VTVLLSETQSSLARERPAPEYRESLEACQRAAQRMRRLIERLLDLAQIEVGPGALQRRKCDLAVIAAECLGEVSILARDHNVATSADLALAPCHGDPDRLAQVITNLIANAIQHTREGGSVRISTSTDKKTVSLVVADTGRGILPEDLPHVFERFYRADKARDGTAGHAGLGLSIAKAIVAAHGGRIEVESQAHHGATFSVVLPCQED
jgi:signal transduction histidine kinase